MVYILVLLIITISFTIIFILNKRGKRRYKKVKPLSKMTKKEFKKAMKDLEIK